MLKEKSNDIFREKNISFIFSFFVKTEDIAFLQHAKLLEYGIILYQNIWGISICFLPRHQGKKTRNVQIAKFLEK